MILKAKRVVERLPAAISGWIHLVPFDLRLGRTYTRTRNEIVRYEELEVESQKSFILERVRSIVRHHFSQNRFYHEFLSSHNFHPAQLRSFEDIKKIPIVGKDDLQKAELELRTGNNHRRAILANTGGTSGEPLEFYLDRHAFAREWAHMHNVWGMLGYKPSHLKLTFRGKNLQDKVIRYNPVHNEYLVNAYVDLSRVAEAVARLAVRKSIKYLHGYPSSIYCFAEYCGRERTDLVDLLNRSLKGILFASEFPAPIFRRTIEQVFTVPNISWYGQSEMAVLAYERTLPYVYVPFHTYGYCEAVPSEDKRSYRLIGTSYNNTASPFIRYDTGDRVRPVFKNGLLESFEIAEGRVGDFICDAKRHRISLTALIFGRHHSIFGKARFVQVYQDRPGTATILVNLKEGISGSDIDWKREFDATSLDIDLNFRIVSEPIRTLSGKIPLLVKTIQSDVIRR